MDVEQTVDQLRSLGMSAYEAKAYITLVTADGPLSGYELARQSGIPRGRAHETLAKLITRSAAVETTSETGAPAYAAVPPPDLFARVRDETAETVSRLEEMFTQLAAPQSLHYTHWLATRRDVLARSRDLIASARVEVLMFMWPDEYHELEPALRRAHDSGIRVVRMMFGDGSGVGQVFRHTWAPPPEIGPGRRLHMLVADGTQVVAGGLATHEGWGIFTDDPAIAMLTRAFIHYDIYLHKLIQEMTPEQRASAERGHAAFSYAHHD